MIAVPLAPAIRAALEFCRCDSCTLARHEDHRPVPPLLATDEPAPSSPKLGAGNNSEARS